MFFNKDVSELTVAECATIVGTTKNPYAYDPFTHWEENQERKEYILGLMLEQGKLTKEEYNAAMAQEIVLATGTNSNATIQTWFVDYVTDEVCRDLAEKQGITEAYLSAGVPQPDPQRLQHRGRAPHSVQGGYLRSGQQG